MFVCKSFNIYGFLFYFFRSQNVYILFFFTYGQRRKEMNKHDSCKCYACTYKRLCRKLLVNYYSSFKVKRAIGNIKYGKEDE